MANFVRRTVVKDVQSPVTQVSVLLVLGIFLLAVGFSMTPNTMWSSLYIAIGGGLIALSASLSRGLFHA